MPLQHERRSSGGAFLLVSALLLGACTSSTIIVFEGAKPPADQIVMILCKPGIAVDAVDGNTRYRGFSKPDLPLIIQLPPGRHTISIHLRQEQRDDRTVGGGMMMRSMSSRESGIVEVSLDFKAGHTYQIDYTTLGRKWRHHVRDITDSRQTPS
jgi:hypothetical protein